MHMIDRISQLSLRITRVAGYLALLMLLPGCCCTNGWIMNSSGMGYYQKGNYAMARGEFARAVMDSPKNPDYRHNMAMAMQKQGDSPQAEQVLRHNLMVAPMHQPTYHALAQILISQQRTGEADQLLTEWRETQPYVPEAYIEQAWFQHETGNRLAAEQTLRQALQVKPNHPVALAHLGQLYHENGQVDQAADFYQRSLLARGNQPEVRSRLATLTGSTSANPNLRRSAMLHNDANVQNVQMVSLNRSPMTDGQMMTATAGIPAGDAIALDDPSAPPRQRRRRRGLGASAQQLTTYPLPTYGLADAGGLPMGMTTAAAPMGFPTTVTASPPLSPATTTGLPETTAMLPEMTMGLPGMAAGQPMLPPPATASTPTLVPQADPAHVTGMTAGLPVVDPY